MLADQDLERRLREMVTDAQGNALPTVHAIAAACHTATRRVSAVLHKLRDEGLIDVRQGLKARAASPVPALPPPVAPRRSAAGSVYQAVRQGIEDGRYQSGSILPKASYFAAQEHVSFSTARRAMHQLAAHGLVHRHGRGYRVGPSPGPQRKRRPGSDPVILLLQCNERWWEDTLQSDWLAPFSLGFMREVNLAGTQVIPVFINRPQAAFVIHGLEEIRAFVRKLGTRHKGTLIAGQSWDYRAATDRSIPEIVEWFAGFDRPVVWFDHIDEPRLPSASFDPAEYAVMIGDRHVGRLFTRCSFDHDGAVRLAMETLHRLGHRRVGVPVLGDEDQGLVDTRIGPLREAAAAFGGMAVLVAEEPSGASDAALPAELLRGLPGAGRDYLRNSGVGAAGQERERLLRLSRVCVPLTCGQRVTALLSLNDGGARLRYQWLRTMGYDVPADLSLISFDAIPRLLYPWQISSVDFGFGYLAYSAYHLIMEDIPVPRTGTELRARSRLNHMGSLGPPRRD